MVSLVENQERETLFNGKERKKFSQQKQTKQHMTTVDMMMNELQNFFVV